MTDFLAKQGHRYRNNVLNVNVFIFSCLNVNNMDVENIYKHIGGMTSQQSIEFSTSHGHINRYILLVLNPTLSFGVVKKKIWIKCFDLIKVNLNAEIQHLSFISKNTTTQMLYLPPAFCVVC